MSFFLGAISNGYCFSSEESGVRSQESGGKKEEGRGRIGEEGESFFITLLSGRDIIVA
ncbi:MAG: hypothetical protein F6K54_35800 [Okeania sp. SIO3B5]|uniref:hypothetical protein n=1 Tax=Okeania sp. SIO3B5 TaxID=2607811 RepID=UPI0013FF92B2|nr:hypothetical protein [Okeania sp. SIO3B5]NEO57952.1 hypothetical protein [Okeania sp. SIO3B5]